MLWTRDVRHASAGSCSCYAFLKVLEASGSSLKAAVSDGICLAALVLVGAVLMIPAWLRRLLQRCRASQRRSMSHAVRHVAGRDRAGALEPPWRARADEGGHQRRERRPNGHRHGPASGLGCSAEAEERAGAARRTPRSAGRSRTYATILRTNVFSFFNTILFVIGVALLALGRYSDALISVGLGLVNALISAVQEIRAKRKLDRPAAARPGTRARRPGRAGGRADAGRGRARRRAAGAAGRPDRRRRTAARRPGRGGRVAAHRRVRPGRQGRTATSCARAACAWPAAATSSPATSGRRATPGGSPPRRARSPPTPPRCSGGSRSSSGW